MYKFEELEKLYKSIISIENGLAEFRGYAIYELEGGIVVWCKVKKDILQNLALQKKILSEARAKQHEFTEEQQAIMKEWKLD